jgi:hypothetical protein
MKNQYQYAKDRSDDGTSYNDINHIVWKNRDQQTDEIRSQTDQNKHYGPAIERLHPEP